MDKFEYKVRSEEIKDLIAQKEYVRAAEIADTIDWRKVKSVMMLCTISDLYKINRRYEDSRDLLLLAYDRHSGGRTIVYALCELSIKIGDLVQAVEYCKEFANIAPKDPSVYILRYKIYEAQNVSLEERIDVLEKLKKYDYREKWAYELAYLYHRVGLESKCVDECDEMIVWFGDGKYVIRAMELKMLHKPLSPEQQEKYDRRFEPEIEDAQENSPQEVYEEAAEAPREDATVTWSKEQVAAAIANAELEKAETKVIPTEEIDIQVKTMDPSQCNTINLQEEVAAGLRELWENEAKEEENSVLFEPMMDTNEFYTDDVTKVMPISKNASVTGAIVVDAEEAAGEAVPEEIYQEAVEEATEEAAEEEVAAGEGAEEEVQEEAAAGEAVNTVETIHSEAVNMEAVNSEADAEEAEPVQKITVKNKPVETPREMAKVLSMEGDGQLSFIMPEKEPAVEKQITGQLSIADIMAEWERMKKELEEKGKEKVRQHVKENTGQMFTEFEASVRDGLLEQLEKGESADNVIARAESYAYEQEDDDIPVPPSLLEVEDTEDAVEELAEIVDMPEDVTQEDYAEGTVVEFEEVEEILEENYEEASAVALEEQPEEIQEELVPVEEDVFEESMLEEIDETALEAAGEFVEIEEELTREEAEEILEEVAEAEEEIAEEFPEEILEELAEAEDVDTEEGEADDDSWGEPYEEGTEESWDDTEAPEEDIEEPEDDAEKPEEAIEELVEDVSEEPEEDTIEETEDGEKASETAVKKKKSTVRALSKEERELFGPYIQGKSSKEQLIHAIDNISMAAYTGNVIITGAEGLDTLGLAKNLVREIQMTDSNFSGKTAKISGEALNKREVHTVLAGLHNGALIIQKATDMSERAVKDLYKELQQETSGIIVIMEGAKKAMNAFLENNSQLHNCFTVRIDMEALSDAALVAFGKKYAREQECSIDEVAALELHRMITNRQTNDHAVTIMEVKEMVDSAIASASRKTLGHFFDIVLSKRYDEEDMIIIREKDFLA